MKFYSVPRQWITQAKTEHGLSALQTQPHTVILNRTNTTLINEKLCNYGRSTTFSGDCECRKSPTHPTHILLLYILLTMVAVHTQFRLKKRLCIQHCNQWIFGNIVFVCLRFQIQQTKPNSLLTRRMAITNKTCVSGKK